MKLDVEELKGFIISKLEEKAADNISVVDLSGKTNIAHYMIFCDGKSYKNVSAVGDFLSLEIKNQFGIDVGIEGVGSSSGWAIVDCGNIIVHIFHPETRDYYKLQEFWTSRR